MDILKIQHFPFSPRLFSIPGSKEDKNSTLGFEVSYGKIGGTGLVLGLKPPAGEIRR